MEDTGMNKLWQFLDNKKSAVSATVNALFMWVVIKGYVSDVDATYLAIVLTAWTGLAVGDKIRKAVQ
jgi:hypothetical protein